MTSVRSAWRQSAGTCQIQCEYGIACFRATANIQSIDIVLSVCRVVYCGPWLNGARYACGLHRSPSMRRKNADLWQGHESALFWRRPSGRVKMRIEKKRRMLNLHYIKCTIKSTSVNESTPSSPPITYLARPEVHEY